MLFTSYYHAVVFTSFASGFSVMFILLPQYSYSMDTTLGEAYGNSVVRLVSCIGDPTKATNQMWMKEEKVGTVDTIE